MNVLVPKPPRGGKTPLEYGRFTRTQLVRAYRRRRDWLESRCAVREAKGEETFFDEVELAMLKWLAEKSQLDLE